MPQHKSAIKAHKQSLIKRDRNRVRKSQVKAFKKLLLGYIASNDFKNAQKAFCKVQSIIWKAVTKNIFSKNKAARYTQKLHLKLKALEEPEAKL